jgi:hypothetical protein
MNAIIPDTLHGAIILSVIDFFLSFIIITGIGVVLALFPLLNRFAQVKQPVQPVATMSDKVDMEADDHVAAITAAVYAMVGAHRIVHIESVHLGGGWVSEGRAAHHVSHAPPKHAPTQHWTR